MLTRAAIILAPLAIGAPALAQASLPVPTASADSDSATAESESEASEIAVQATGARKLAIARRPYPREIRHSLSFGRKLCRQEGGTSVTYPAGIVRTGDLTGDGRPDYIVDFRGSVCAGRSYLFTGTGGWDFEIMVARPNGRLTAVFAQRIRDYDLSDGPGPRAMTFTLHGGFCGLAGADDCIKERRIDGRRFAFRDR